MSDPNIGQRIGAAGNQAAMVLQGALAHGVTIEQVQADYGILVETFAGVMNDIQNGNQVTSQVAAQVGQAFPGTVEATPAEVQQHFQQATSPVPPQQAFQPSPVAQPAPVPAAPASIPGATDGDPQTAALWQEFFQDPTRWWDNRTGKRNPKAPDFKHKDNGDKALWLTGNKNPSWVAGQLAAIGMS